MIVDDFHGAIGRGLRHLLIEIVHLLSHLLLLRSADLGHYLKAPSMESYQFAAKAESCTALGVQPARRVAGTGLLTRDRLSKGWLCRVLVRLTHLLGALRVE